ncbi:MAG TPA: hypothetical protein VGU20_18110 [Stellaceae bacterium]|nr:hypothetical protein [Stellaceae bacterium]
MSIYTHVYRGSSGLINGMRMLEESYGSDLILPALVTVLLAREKMELAHHIERCALTLPRDTSVAVPAFNKRR